MILTGDSSLVNAKPFMIFARVGCLVTTLFCSGVACLWRR
jgi:hypothetical protein